MENTRFYGSVTKLRQLQKTSASNKPLDLICKDRNSEERKNVEDEQTPTNPFWIYVFSKYMRIKLNLDLFWKLARRVEVYIQPEL